MDPKSESLELVQTCFYGGGYANKVKYSRAILLNHSDHIIYLRWAEEFKHESLLNAKDRCVKAIQINPNDDYSYIALGNALCGQNEHEKALAQYKIALQLGPFNRDAINQYAICLVTLKRYKELDAFYKDIVQQDSWNSRLYEDLTYFLMNKGNNEATDRMFAKAIEVAPKDESLYLRWAELLIDQHRYGEAEEKYALAADATPDSCLIYSNWANLLKKLRRYKEAAALYAKSLEIDGQEDAYVNYIVILYRLKNYEEIDRICKIAIEKFRNNSDLIHIWGNSLEELGRFEEAEAKYAKAVEAFGYFGPNRIVYHSWGRTLLKQRKLEEAKGQYWKAIKLNENDFDAYMHIIDILVAQGKFKEANLLFIEVEKIQNNGIFYEKWGIALFNQKKYEEAKDKFIKVTELEPYYSNGYHFLGVILYYQKNFAEAKTKYLQAIEIGSDDGGLYMNYGLTLYHLEDKEGALEMFRKAVDIIESTPGEKENALKMYSAGVKEAEAERLVVVNAESQYKYLTVRIEGMNQFLSLLNTA